MIIMGFSQNLGSISRAANGVCSGPPPYRLQLPSLPVSSQQTSTRLVCFGTLSVRGVGHKEPFSVGCCEHSTDR